MAHLYNLAFIANSKTSNLIITNRSHSPSLMGVRSFILIFHFDISLSKLKGNITCAGSNLAFAASDALGNVDMSCAGMCDKHLFAK